jgi:hypothetical protein
MDRFKEDFHYEENHTDFFSCLLSCSLSYVWRKSPVLLEIISLRLQNKVQQPQKPRQDCRDLRGFHRQSFVPRRLQR